MAARSREGAPRGASASANLTGIRNESLVVRASALARRPSFRVVLAALAVAAATAVTVLAVDRALRANGVERADARLAAALRASAAALEVRVSAAGAEAQRLAASRTVQIALSAHDRRRLARTARSASAPVVIRGSRGARAGRPIHDAIRRSATIGPAGSRVGQVTAFVPLDLALLRRIERLSDARAGVALALARRGAEDHRQERLRIVRRGQSVPHERERVASALAPDRGRPGPEAPPPVAPRRARPPPKPGKLQHREEEQRERRHRRRDRDEDPPPAPARRVDEPGGDERDELRRCPTADDLDRRGAVAGPAQGRLDRRSADLPTAR